MTRLLLLHGIQSGGTTWWRVAPDLRALGHEVATPDLPGHAGRPAGAPSLAALADAVPPEEPAVVVGHSLGAIVALTLAARRPDLVQALVLEDPPTLNGRPAREVAGDLSGSAAEARADPAGLEGRLRQENPLWARDDAGHAVRNRAALDVAAALALLDADPWDLPALVRAAPVPTLLLAAEGPGSALTGDERGATLSAADRVVAAPSGHGVHRERPGLWTAVVHEVARAHG